MPKRLPSAEGGKRFPLNMRTTEAMRLRLEAEANASGRSLAQEVEYALDQYYSTKNELDTLRKPVVQMIALSLKQAEMNTGRTWYEDEVTAQTFRNAVNSIIDLLFPFKPVSNIVARKGRVDDALDLLDAGILAQDAVRGLDDGEAVKVRERVRALVDRMNEGWDEAKGVHVLSDETDERPSPRARPQK